MSAISSVLQPIVASATDVAIVAAALLCILFRVIQFNRVIRWWHDHDGDGCDSEAENRFSSKTGGGVAFQDRFKTSDRDMDRYNSNTTTTTTYVSPTIHNPSITPGGNYRREDGLEQKTPREERRGECVGREQENSASRMRRAVRERKANREEDVPLMMVNHSVPAAHPNILQSSFSFVASFAMDEPSRVLGPPPLQPPSSIYPEATQLTSIPGRPYREGYGRKENLEPFPSPSATDLLGGQTNSISSDGGGGEHNYARFKEHPNMDDFPPSTRVPPPPQWETDFHVSRRNELIFMELPLNVRIQAAVNWLSVISNCLTDFLRPSQVLYTFLFSSCDFMLYTLTPEEEEEDVIHHHHHHREGEGEGEGDDGALSSSSNSNSRSNSSSTTSGSYSSSSADDDDDDDGGRDRRRDRGNDTTIKDCLPSTETSPCVSSKEKGKQRIPPKVCESGILVHDASLSSPSREKAEKVEEEEREAEWEEELQGASKGTTFTSLRRIKYWKHRCAKASSNAFACLRTTLSGSGHVQEATQLRGGLRSANCESACGDGDGGQKKFSFRAWRPRWMEWSRVQMALRRIVRSPWCVRVFPCASVNGCSLPFGMQKSNRAKNKWSDVEDGGFTTTTSRENEEDGDGDVCLNLESEGTAWLMVNSILLFTLLIFHLHGLFFVVGQACGYIASLGTLYVLGREVGDLLADLQEYTALFHNHASNAQSNKWGSKQRTVRSFFAFFLFLLCPPWLLSRIRRLYLWFTGLCYKSSSGIFGGGNYLRAAGKLPRLAYNAMRTIYRFLIQRNCSKQQNDDSKKSMNTMTASRMHPSPQSYDIHSDVVESGAAPKAGLAMPRDYMNPVRGGGGGTQGSDDSVPFQSLHSFPSSTPLSADPLFPLPVPPPPYHPPELPIAVLTNASLARYYVCERFFSIMCSIIYAVMLLDEGEALYSTHVELMRWYANTIGLALADTVQLLRFLLWKRVMNKMKNINNNNNSTLNNSTNNTMNSMNNHNESKVTGVSGSSIDSTVAVDAGGIIV